MKALKGILGGIRQADQKFTLFNEKDKILIGVSGGKDSMVLAYSLIQYQKFEFVNFEIVLAILDLGFPNFDATGIVKYFESIGQKLHVIDSTDVYKILKIQQKDSNQLPCSICSRMKKAAINKVAKELGCNKVAFAHHADDAIETLFLNEIYGGRVATFQPKMHLERADINFIRPFILVRESEIIQCQKEENIPSFSSHCPNEGITKRAEMKELLNQIYKKYPSAKENFLTMLSNYEKEGLFYEDIYYKLERKDLSLKPVISLKDSLIEQNLRTKLNKPNLSQEPSLKRFIIYKLDKPIGVIALKQIDNLFIIEKPSLVRNSEKTKNDILNFVKKEIERKVDPVSFKIRNKI
ncbi:MAG: tRNA 2-thiocytidine biosynthesis TtcA family protein [Bacilli bacterium]|nr:tRNA 2-thiocytidine biosynthesis TtcA family protein [Bacilli bacterium]